MTFWQQLSDRQDSVSNAPESPSDPRTSRFGGLFLPIFTFWTTWDARMDFGTQRSGPKNRGWRPPQSCFLLSFLFGTLGTLLLKDYVKRSPPPSPKTILQRFFREVSQKSQTQKTHLGLPPAPIFGTLLQFATKSRILFAVGTKQYRLRLWKIQQRQPKNKKHRSDNSKSRGVRNFSKL